MTCLNPTFHWCHNLAFFGLGPWAIIHGIVKLANTFYLSIWTLMIPFERSLSKLSENHKIIEIGSTEFKLWQLKESPNHWITPKLPKLKLWKFRGGGCLGNKNTEHLRSTSELTAMRQAPFSLAALGLSVWLSKLLHLVHLGDSDN